ncbi:hypothetical protein HDE69_004406 [Pedobacter cryoconitis]|uniref:Uncharacterized protein n=1 Tax=Pedobacter cryoconitis TaxID=188932 RepID=A0A7W8YWX9_9SPHI|nr:hypothetical protein [Pedobacter cryoconitis]MBB5623322.1 hypothetical protein [Pedobacter cryoconitis]
MNNNPEIVPIKKCLELIENKLNRGAGSEWTSYDFEMLSNDIQTATGVILSVTTLKRLWGRLKYGSTPTTTTLNTLAKFAGYNDWREFKHKLPLDHLPMPIAENLPLETGVKKADGKWKYWLSGLSLLLITSYVILLLSTQTKASVEHTVYKFSSNKIKTAGLPNSVIFNYDATAADKDSVFISQSWDITRKVVVPAQQHTYSSIYYNPGYYRAKLIVGQQIVKEHDLMISSDGWLAMVHKDGGVPLYFKKNEVLKNNKIEVNEEILSKYNIPLQPALPELRFYNVRDMGDLRNDHFILETTLKSDFHQGNAACQRVEVLILCKDETIIIPLCSKGCVGDLSLYVAGTTVESKNTDLSKFGCNLDEWVKVRVESKNRHMRFFINGEEAYSLNFFSKPAAIVGLQYRFNGTGAVKDTRFIKDERIINF